MSGASLHIARTGTRRTTASKASASETKVKYCSDRCKRNKPSNAPTSLERRIEATFLALLNDQPPPPPPPSSTVPATTEQSSTATETSGVQLPSADGNETTPAVTSTSTPSTVTLATPTRPAQPHKKPPGTKKGDHRILVPCSRVETLIYGRIKDPNKVYGRRRNRAKRGFADVDADGRWRSVDMVSSEESGSDDDSSEAGGGDGDGDGDGHGNGGVDWDSEAQHTDGSASESVSARVSRLSLDAAQHGANRRVAERKAKRSEEYDDDEDAGGVSLTASSNQPNTTKSPNSQGLLVSDDQQKRREGQKKAEERETVRCAARRACVFGLLVPASMQEQDSRGGGVKGSSKGKKGSERAAKRKGLLGSEDEGLEVVGEGFGGKGSKEVRWKCEAIMSGMVVEPSFAKGDWGIRFREER